MDRGASYFVLEGECAAAGEYVLVLFVEGFHDLYDADESSFCFFELLGTACCW